MIKKGNIFILALVGVVLISVVAAGVFFWQKYQTEKTQKEESICPVNGWLNCMPILSEEGKREGKRQCNNVDWFKKNCPNFQGIAQ